MFLRGPQCFFFFLSFPFFSFFSLSSFLLLCSYILLSFLFLLIKVRGHHLGGRSRKRLKCAWLPIDCENFFFPITFHTIPYSFSFFRSFFRAFFHSFIHSFILRKRFIHKFLFGEEHLLAITGPCLPPPTSYHFIASFSLPLLSSFLFKM